VFSTVQELFGKFKTKAFNLDYQSSSTRSSVVDNDVLKYLADADTRLTLDEIEIKMECWSVITYHSNLIITNFLLLISYKLL